MTYRRMTKLACLIAVDVYDLDKHDIEAMVESVDAETVVDFLKAYRDLFGLDLKDKIEWALLAEV